MLEVTSNLLTILLPSEKLTSMEIAGKDVAYNAIGKEADLPQITYTLQKLSDILQHGNQSLANDIGNLQVPSTATSGTIEQTGTDNEIERILLSSLKLYFVNRNII
jgi:hypothetical protein